MTGPVLLPAGTTVACQGRLHRLAWADGVLTALDHDDVDGELVLGALGGEPTACAQVVAAWRHAADDLRVLVLASRGPADVLVAGDDRLWPATVPPAGPTTSSFGWYGYSSMSSSSPHGHHGHGHGGVEELDADQLLAGLFELGGGLPERLVATVVRTWADRLAAGSAPTAGLAALTVALHTRVEVAVRQWRHDSAPVAVTMLPPGSPGTLRAGEDGVEVELPFSWLADVWVSDLAVVLGRLVLGATLDGPRLLLDTVGPRADRQQLVITLPD